MSPAESYKLMVLKNPEGVLLPDVYYIDAGRRRPVVFKRVGEMIDLERVDAKAFVASARAGSLFQMEKSGSVKKFQFEASVKVTDAINAEYSAYDSIPKPNVGFGGGTQTVELEPGVMVAVGSGYITGQINHSDLAQAQPIFAGVSGEGEPVAVAPKVDQGLAATPAVGGASLDDAEAAPKAVVVPEVKAAPSWKDSKTLNEQEACIRVSRDKAFLESVVADLNESKKLKKLAKTILADLEG